MPIGIQRLNAKKSQPNTHIVFIKPLKGPDEEIARDYLEKIAAQCFPVMRDHKVYVMSLEEFSPNEEFVGRNFNAGEVVQLVLKSPRSGRWLPFNYVQMVMMHELAHCKQMNHSKAFWAVRNQYAAQMQALWAQGYKGDGIWGRGARLGTGEWERDSARADEVLPGHLCGGTYRSRRGKRTARPVLTYQERKERRILKRFGKDGMALGADDETKAKLEKGKRIQAKPTVASSARGRELRAAAALARFGQDVADEPGIKDEGETDSNDTSDYGDVALQDTDLTDAIDVDGTRLVDENGRGMVKVCEDQATDGVEARDELDELHSMFGGRRIKREPAQAPSLGAPGAGRPRQPVKQEGQSVSTHLEAADGASSPTLSHSPRLRPNMAGSNEPDVGQRGRAGTTTPAAQSTSSSSHAGSTKTSEATRSCSTCSLANSRLAATCAMCANVLDPSSAPGAWRCSRATCTNTAYMNSGDCGVCGLCEGRKETRFDGGLAM